MFRQRIQLISHNQITRISLYKRGIYISGGSLLVSISLELFLVKNHVIDGGIVGVAIIISYLTNINLGFLLLILNVPFLLIGYKLLGKVFTILSLYAILVLAIGTFILHPMPVLTNNPVMAVVLGGIILGVGVGIILRYGGSLDGTEIIAILLSEKTSYSIGEYVMFFNLFILGSSSFVFGFDKAMYSLVTYFIAYQTIDITIDGIKIK